MYYGMCDIDKYNHLLIDSKAGSKVEETPDLKSRIKDLILKIDRLKIQEPEERNRDIENFNNGIIHARNLLISEVKNIICPVCAKKRIEDKEEPVYLQD